MWFASLANKITFNLFLVGNAAPDRHCRPGSSWTPFADRLPSFYHDDHIGTLLFDCLARRVALVQFVFWIVPVDARSGWTSGLRSPCSDWSPSDSRRTVTSLYGFVIRLLHDDRASGACSRSPADFRLGTNARDHVAVDQVGPIADLVQTTRELVIYRLAECRRSSNTRNLWPIARILSLFTNSWSKSSIMS